MQSESKKLVTEPYMYRYELYLDMPAKFMEMKDWKLEMTLISEEEELANYVYYPVLPKYR